MVRNSFTVFMEVFLSCRYGEVNRAEIKLPLKGWAVPDMVAVSVTSALYGLGQEAPKFQASLGYIVRSY